MRTTIYQFSRFQTCHRLKLYFLLAIGCLALPPSLLDAQIGQPMKKFNSKRVATAETTKSHSEVAGIIRIINPTHRGKVRNDTESCKAFVANYRPDGTWIYLTHQSEKKKKNSRWVSEIIVWDSSRELHILDPDDMEKLVKFLLRHMECATIKPILKDALMKASTARVVSILARLVCDEELRTFAYQQYFATFYRPKAVWEGLRDISKPDDLIKEQAALAAARTINCEELLLEYLEYFKGYYHDVAFERLAQSNSCSSVLGLLQQDPLPKQLKDLRPPNMEKVEVECINNPTDFLAYLAKYPGGSYQDMAAEKIAAQLLVNCQLIAFIKAQPVQAARFKHIFFEEATECVRAIDDCIQLNKVYNKEEDIKFVLGKASSKFPLSDLVQLTKSPIYSPFKKDLEPLFFASIFTVNDVDVFLNHFPNAAEEHEQKALQMGMQFAQEDSNLTQLSNYLVRYLAKGWSYEDIQEFLDCNTIIEVAQQRIESRTPLHEPILSCVGTDTASIKQYLIFYPPNVELLAREKVPVLTAQETKFFFRNYGDPGGHIERHFPQKVRTVEDVDFYFKNFRESPFLGEALKKGISFAEKEEDKFQMIKRYFDDFGYHSSDALMYLEDCPERIAFARTYPAFQDSLCLLSRECVRDIPTAKEISRTCGISLAELGIGPLVYDSMYQALNTSPQDKVFDLANPEALSFSLPTRGWEVMGITMEAPRKYFPFDLELMIGDSIISFRLDKDKPVRFFSLQELPKGEAMSVHLRSSAKDKGEVKLHLINFPNILEASFVRNQYYDATSRGDLIQALDQIRDQNMKERFHRTVVSSDLYEVLNSASTISEDQLNGLMHQLAQHYVMIYDKIPKGLGEWPSRTWNNFWEYFKRD